MFDVQLFNLQILKSKILFFFASFVTFCSVLFAFIRVHSWPKFLASFSAVFYILNSSYILRGLRFFVVKLSSIIFLSTTKIRRTRSKRTKYFFVAIIILIFFVAKKQFYYLWLPRFFIVCFIFYISSGSSTLTFFGNFVFIQKPVHFR